MTIKDIVYSKDFLDEFSWLPKHIKTKSISQLEILSKNPFYPSLRLHKLHGKLDWHWSISINKAYRIIFKPQNNWDVLLVSIWTHSIYEK